MSNFLRLHVQLDILIVNVSRTHAKKKEEEEEEERRKYNTEVINLLLECENVPLF